MQKPICDPKVTWMFPRKEPDCIIASAPPVNYRFCQHNHAVWYPPLPTPVSVVGCMVLQVSQDSGCYFKFCRNCFKTPFKQPPFYVPISDNRGSLQERWGWWRKPFLSWREVFFFFLNLCASIPCSQHTQRLFQLQHLSETIYIFPREPLLKSWCFLSVYLSSLFTAIPPFYPH